MNVRQARVRILEVQQATRESLVLDHVPCWHSKLQTMLWARCCLTLYSSISQEGTVRQLHHQILLELLSLHLAGTTVLLPESGGEIACTSTWRRCFRQPEVRRPVHTPPSCATSSGGSEDERRRPCAGGGAVAGVLGPRCRPNICGGGRPAALLEAHAQVRGRHRQAQRPAKHQSCKSGCLTCSYCPPPPPPPPPSPLLTAPYLSPLPPR